MPPEVDAAVIEEDVFAAERNAALPLRCRELLSMMMICDPPCRYDVIRAALDMPVDSIGPMRASCLDRIRRSPHIRLSCRRPNRIGQMHSGRR